MGASWNAVHRENDVLGRALDGKLVKPEHDDVTPISNPDMTRDPARDHLANFAHLDPSKGRS